MRRGDTPVPRCVEERGHSVRRLGDWVLAAGRLSKVKSLKVRIESLVRLRSVEEWS